MELAHTFGRDTPAHLVEYYFHYPHRVFGVRMLHMLTDSAMSASGVQIEGTTFVRVKILDYHDMLPFLLPIHLYKHQNMIKFFM